MFEPGSIVMVRGKPPYLTVAVERNLGAIKGVGWLLYTKEGNFVLATGSDQYVAKVVFILDEKILAALSFLLSHPEAKIHELQGFAAWLTATGFLKA